MPINGAQAPVLLPGENFDEPDLPEPPQLLIWSQVISGKVSIQGQVKIGAGGGSSTPAADFTATATEACGFDDDSSIDEPVDIGGNVFYCNGMSADANPYTATARD